MILVVSYFPSLYIPTILIICHICHHLKLILQLLLVYVCFFHILFIALKV
jgi:hypothetical protein